MAPAKPTDKVACFRYAYTCIDVARESERAHPRCKVGGNEAIMAAAEQRNDVLRLIELDRAREQRFRIRNKLRKAFIDHETALESGGSERP
jgi:hypothetical protein